MCKHQKLIAVVLKYFYLFVYLGRYDGVDKAFIIIITNTFITSVFATNIVGPDR